MADSDENILSRWSRRKRSDLAEPAPGPMPSAEAGTALPESVDQGAAPVGGDRDEADVLSDEELAALPDPETLDADADFTVFMKQNVPEVLRRRALRCLWRSNPLLAGLDGLNDYDDDFTDAATVVAGLKTLYQVGKGFVVEEEEAQKADDSKTDESASEAPAEESDQDPGELSTDEETTGEPAVVAALEDETAPSAATSPAPLARRRGALERRWGRTED